MAKRGSGFGNPKSLSFKGVKTSNNRIDRVPPIKAAGSYPSDRQYGTLVQRTIIESYDAESDWIRWRTGYEYYTKAAMEDIIVAAPVKGSPAAIAAEAEGKPVYDPGLTEQDNPELPNYNPQYIPFVQNAQLYSDTEFFLDIQFTGRRFSTKNSDTANHYCIKRSLTELINMFNVTEVLYANNPDPTLASYAVEAKANNEIWVKGTRQRDFSVLARSLGDRLTDGEVNDSKGQPVEVDGTSTEATLTLALNSDAKPSVYLGKSTLENPTQITILVPYTDIAKTEFFKENGENLNAYIGKIGYLPQFYNIKTFSRTEATHLTFTDGPYYFEVELEDGLSNDDPGPSGTQGFYILDRETTLPPSMYDVADLPTIFATGSYQAKIAGKYLFQKSDYQRFFGQNYLTAQLVEQQVNETSYPTLPFIIQSVKRTNALVEFTAQPFISTLDLFDIPDKEEEGFLVFADYSFTQTKLDTDIDGEYLHPIQGPYNTVQEQSRGEEKFAKEVWYKKINDINPYDTPFVKLFTQQNTGLRPATIYACSCPNYSKTQLRMPQATQGVDERKINRQQNYPLPTVQGRTDYNSIGVNTAAGKMQSWQTIQQRNSFNICKHSIASMFKDHLKLQEPNTYQTLAAREQFGRKLEQDMQSQIKLFQEAYARGGISLLEVIFAMAEGINYDEVDLAYIVLNADDQAKSASEALAEGSVTAQRFPRVL